MADAVPGRPHPQEPMHPPHLGGAWSLHWGGREASAPPYDRISGLQIPSKKARQGESYQTPAHPDSVQVKRPNECKRYSGEYDTVSEVDCSPEIHRPSGGFGVPPTKEPVLPSSFLCCSPSSSLPPFCSSPPLHTPASPLQPYKLVDETQIELGMEEFLPTMEESVDLNYCLEKEEYSVYSLPSSSLLLPGREDLLESNNCNYILPDSGQHLGEFSIYYWAWNFTVS